jgi:hypothetical protein
VRYVRGCREDRLGLLRVAVRPADANIPRCIRPDLRSVLFQRVFHVHDVRKRLDIHFDAGSRIGGLVSRFGHDEGDRLANITHPPLRKPRTSRVECLAELKPLER